MNPRVLPVFSMLAVIACAAMIGACDLFPVTPGNPTFPYRDPWPPFVVNNTANVRPTVVALADMNVDGRLDVIAAYEGNAVEQPEVVVFFQVFMGNNITWNAVTAGQAANLNGIAGLAVEDIDADTRRDIIAAANGRLIYLKAPADPTNALLWQSYVIANSEGAGLGQWNDVRVGQIDNLNGVDIVAANATPGRVSFFAAPMNPTTGAGWTRFDIDDVMRAGAAGILLVHLDGDTRLDVISTAPGEASARLAWYRNPGGNAMMAWSRFTIGNINSATRLALGDLDRDGRSDVVVTNPGALSAPGANDGIQVGWYRQPTNPTTPWVGHVLCQFDSNTPTDVFVADVDVNGNPDVVVSTRADGTLRWFARRDNIEQLWIENNLADLTADANRIAVGDIDLDARVDVVAALRAASETNDIVRWYQNPLD